MSIESVALDLPVDALARYSRQNHIVRLEVFGSAARGELTEGSDVDLLVTFAKDAPIGLMDFARIRRELSEIVGRPVDLVTPAALKPRIRDGILKSAIEVYALN